MSGQTWMIIAILAIIFLFLCYKGVKPLPGGG
jgi:hypothetical protein